MLTLTIDEIVNHDTLTSEERKSISEYMKKPCCDLNNTHTEEYDNKE